MINEEISVALHLEDWVNVTGALVFLETFDAQGRLKNLSDRINNRIIYQLTQTKKELEEKQ